MKLKGLDIIAFLVSSLILNQPCLSHDAPFAGRAQSISSDNAGSNSTQYPTIKDSNRTSTSAMPLATGIRPVYLVMHVRLTGAQTIPPTYEKLFPAYASLHFNATSTDGPLEIQVINDNGQDLIRVTDWGLQNSDKPMGVPQSGYLVDYFELFGKSNATNNQILNPTTGKGIVHDVWTRNNSLALKAYNSIDFMHACIAQLGLGLAPSNSPSAIIPTRIAQAQKFWRNLWVAEKVVSQYPIWLETLKGWGDQVQKTRTEFHWQVGADPSAGMVQSRPVPTNSTSAELNSVLNDNGMSDLAAPEMTETYQASDDTVKTAPEYQWIYSQPALQKSIQRRDQPTVAQPTVEDQYLVYNPGEDDYPVIGQKLEEGTNEYAMKPANDLNVPVNRPDIAAEARTLSQNVMALVRSVGVIGGFSGIITIVVADFQNPNNGASLICGLFSIMGGFLGMLLLFGPALLSEFIILSSVIVGEIPKMASSSQTYSSPHPRYTSTHDTKAHWRRSPSGPTPPLRTDVQGILQYTIVGDRNQTGNEKCLSKGYKECTIVYGPYLLAAALQIETFDAFALLIHYNEGYPMAMKDLVKAFTLSTDPDSANKIATIDCSGSSRPNDRFSWSSESFSISIKGVGSDLSLDPNQATVLKSCDKPVFSIKRQLINLPILNQTADQIYSRMMPQGNCSLVGDVSGGEKFPAYNITLQGGAVAIACGVIGAINVNGTARPLPGAPLLPGKDLYNGSLAAHQSVPLSIASPGNQSSDGSSGRAYLAPPPVSPFQMTLNLTNSICMSAPDGSNLYFPNGTYSSQGGSLGFDSTKANTLSLAAKSSLVVTESAKAKSKGIYAHAPAPPPTYVNHQVTYNTNQSATDTKFAADMQDMVKYKEDNTFAVNVQIEPDAVCFYEQPLGKGDFACFGPGGGDLPAALKGKARSVKAFGSASVEVFANGYGNSFSHIFDTYQDDLAQLPYDKQSSFADVAASIWVYLEPGSSMPTGTGSS